MTMASHAACKIKIASETYGLFFNSIRFVDSPEQPEFPENVPGLFNPPGLGATASGNPIIDGLARGELSLSDGATFYWSNAGHKSV